MQHRWVLVLAAAVALASCNFGKSPLAPTAIPVASPPVPPPPLPTAVPGVLAIAMPIDPGDYTTTAFGIGPFGYHGADHADDGHPGWDVEYRPGSFVRAAAAGTVLSVFPDPSVPGRSTVQIEHVVGSHHYRTVYTNLASVTAEIVEDAVVRSGQPLGVAGSITATIGTATVTYAMTHFQLDDFEFYREELPNPNAVSPEPFLSSDGRAAFDRMWTLAVFGQEPVEPFPTNPRGLPFAGSRTWTRAGGDGPAGIRFTRLDRRGSDYTYALLTESGTAIETGTAAIGLTTRPHPTIDLVSATSRRLGLYDIVSNELRLSLALPGSARPTDIGLASIYRTTR